MTVMVTGPAAGASAAGASVAGAAVGAVGPPQAASSEEIMRSVPSKANILLLVFIFFSGYKWALTFLE
jgi:hypothetical protein